MVPTTTSPSLSALAELLLFGAGGHARVVADALIQAEPALRAVASDRDPARCQGELLPGLRLCAIQEAEAMHGMPVHIAIGANVAREREARAWGIERLRTVVHPAATVSLYARLQPGCFVAAGAVVGPQADIGTSAIVNHGAVADHDVHIGAFAHVAPKAALGGGVRIGRRVLVGAGAVVLPGISIADDVLVGAGAVVCVPLLEVGTYVGVPARRIA